MTDKKRTNDMRGFELMLQAAGHLAEDLTVHRGWVLLTGPEGVKVRPLHADELEALEGGK